VGVAKPWREKRKRKQKKSLPVPLPGRQERTSGGEKDTIPISVCEKRKGKKKKGQ